MVRLTGFLIGALISALIFTAPATADWPFGTPATLGEIAERLAERHQRIEHISTIELAAMRRTNERFILLDVREASEFDVSYIPGAIRVDPGAGADDIRGLLIGTDPNVPIVVYCAVGTRASRLGTRLTRDLDGHPIMNVRGGIFAWHNENRPLENGIGATELVHPYSQSRVKLLNRSELASRQAAL
ncbi:MAG: rhodanese-like domain-containing protein [Pseudomonadota bacterium]